MIVVYNQETGEIKQAIQIGIENYSPSLENAQAFLIAESADIRTEYVLNGAITPRPAQATVVDKYQLQANIADTVTVSGAPSDAEFIAENLSTGKTVSGAISGSDSFFTAVAGRFRLTVKKWPFLDWSVIVVAV